MSLGAPVLYIDNRQIQTRKDDPRPALAGLKIDWGSDDAQDTAPAAKLSGQMLIRGAMPAWLDVGAPVGLIDPASSRCLFAGTLEPLTAAPDPSVPDAYRVSFTASSPKAELEKHNVLDIDWPFDEPAANRRNRLASAMPRGWTLDGAAGWTWIPQGRQKYQSVPWLELANRYAAGQLLRIHDTSTYVPGAGLRKRITISRERPKSATMPGGNPKRGSWLEYGGTAASTGIAILPPAAIDRPNLKWEKTPADVVTDVQITTSGGAYPSPADSDSSDFEFWMSVYTDNSAMQDAYGYRQLRVETALAPSTPSTIKEAIRLLLERWLDTKTPWRPTTLALPNSNWLDDAPLLNLLAVDTRHMAAVAVPAATAAPGRIFAFVLAGTATWTGKKWETELTLGRTL